MKLKYTLVFTIISFFIATAGFAQTYSDREIGLNVEKLTVALKEHGIKEENIEQEIAQIRHMKLGQFLHLKKESDIILQTIKATSRKVSVTDIIDIPVEEKAVLKALYDNNGGANWENKSGWDFDTPVTSWDNNTQTGWYGITVSSGHVERIQLVRQNLNGILTNLTPLTNLKELALGNNNFIPGNFPSWITNLSKLEKLSLGASNFTGAFPNLSSLQTLTQIDLSQNRFDVGIMPSWFTLLPNLFSLKVFDCNFKGPIPNLSNLNQLVWLHIGYNDFSTETIPTWLNSMTQLRELDISVSKLKGEIPNLSNLTNLELFYFSNNELTGTVPNYFNYMPNLRNLSFGNNKLTGSLPEVSELKKLIFYNFSSNQMSGIIPELSSAINLEYIYLDDNQLTGTIPNISNLNLNSLNLSFNQLTGNLPNLKPYSNQYFLLLNSNQLTGTIPDFSTLTSLYELDISFNQLTGSIPSFANSPNISRLRLDNNQFSGHIPSMTTLTSLVFVSINHNKFRFLDFVDQFEFLNARTFGHSPQAIIDIPQTFDKKSGESVTFKMCLDDVLDPGDTFQWFRNGQKINQAISQTYTIPNLSTGLSGTYTCLSYHDIPGMKLALAREPITLNVTCAELLGSIKMDKEEANAGTSINFSFETQRTNLTYYWNFYNSDNNHVFHGETGNTRTSFNLPGNYRLDLTIIDQTGCRTDIQKYFTILPRVCPDIVSGIIKTTSTNLFVNANTYFYFETASNVLNYLWTFYDLNNNITETIYGSDILKSFDRPGNYIVSLTTIDQNGCETNFNKNITVTQPQPCTTPETGAIIVQSEELITGQYLDFYFDTLTEDLNYNWTFYNPDDSVNSYMTNSYASIKFENQGNYKINLIITDRNGCTATFNKTFNVIPDCRKLANIYTTNYSVIEPVLPNTDVSVLLYPSDFNLEGMQLDWELISPSGEIIRTGLGNNFTVSAPAIGNYKINARVTDPTTGCINNFSTILQSVSECTFTDKNRFAYISPNGDYEYSKMALYYNINDTINFGLFRPFYWDTGKVFNLEWSLYNPNSELISTLNDVQFPVTLTTPGFYKVVVNVIDPDTGCSTELSRSISSTIQGSCTETNDRSYYVQEVVTNFVKRLIIRAILGETDAQINANSVSDEFINLKPFITNSPKDKVYNFATVRNEYNRIENVTFSFSPDRTSDIHISFRDGLELSNTDPNYLENRIGDFIMIDLSQYVSSDQYLGSCSLYYPSGRSQAKSIIDPQGCFFSSEIKNINFCPPACNDITGTLKQSTQGVFTNRNTNFSLETTATDLTYRWAFFNLGNEGFTVYTTNTVDKTYLQEGSYDINLEVTDANGCVTTFNKTVIVTANTECVPLAGTIKTSTPDVVVLTDTNFSLETAETDLAYKWTFYYNNESTVFTTKTVDYTYATPGTYNVALEVTDLNGCKSTFQKTVALKTGPALCENITQYGRAYIKVDGNQDIFKSAIVNVNQVTNVTFPIVNYGGAGYDFTYKWSLYNDNDELLNSGTALNFPITPTIGGYYKAVLELTEHNSGCIQEFTKSIVCLIPSSCTQTNAQSSVVKGLVVNVLKNLISRSIAGESDVQINASNASAEFTALTPYITNGPKDKIYNYATARSLTNEITGVNFSFSPNSVYDIHLSVPHDFQYQQGMPLEYLLGLIESKINLNQYVSPNQYLVTCLTPSRPTGKSSLLQPSDCTSESEIRYINFCPVDCQPILGTITASVQDIYINTNTNFSFETSATDLTYLWTFQNVSNNTTFTTATANYSYYTPGDYNITLVVTDNNGCSSTFNKTITALYKAPCVPIAGEIKIPTETVNLNETTTFSFQTTATNFTYKWTFFNTNFVEVGTATTSTVNRSYNKVGDYLVRLVLTDQNGCITTIGKSVKVVAGCTPVIGSITVNTENPALYTTPVFTFETTATNLTYSWTVKIPESSTGYYNYATGGNPFELYLQYGPGDYKIMLEVKDASGCITKFEKIITAAFDCTTVHRDISIQNVNRHAYGFDPMVLFNAPNPFTFYPPAGEGETIEWTMTKLNGDVISSTSNAEFVITPTELGDYKINFKIVDTNGCESNFTNDITVVGNCQYTNEQRYGVINFVDEYSNGAAFINLNETKTLGYRFFDNEDTDNVSYNWAIFDPNNVRLMSYEGKTFPITLTTPGFHRVDLNIEDLETGCMIKISKSIGTIITNSCTDTNPKSEIVKGLYLDLVKNLIARSIMGETDAQINASPANAQFTALVPYITNGIKDKIYNYKTVRVESEGSENNSLTSIDFSFTPDRESDIRVYFKWGPYYDPAYDTYEDLLANIEDRIYFNMSQYTSPDIPLISCYVDNGGKMAGNNPVKPSLDECSRETIAQYIDFCPAEECKPIVGILKSINTTGSAGTSKIKVSPSLKK